MKDIFYALGLHMHQPPGNLKLLIEHNEWEAQQIIRCYERAARYAHMYKDVAYLHVGFSGILLEQFMDPQIIDRYRQFVDIPKMIELYRSAKNIEILGMGYYHPIFPLIPREDWDQQLLLGREMIEKVFGRAPTGFWPPEMAFCMEVVPALKKAGYEYVVVDHVHVRPSVQTSRFDSFKPYTAKYGSDQICIIPRNRDLSNAQESGLDPAWFTNEVSRKLADPPGADKARLVTTWSDGENGGWFRQTHEEAGFFGHFFEPLARMMQGLKTRIRFTKISDFLKKYPPKDAATVNTGAWNVGSTSGYDFAQWSGSESQRRAIKALFDASKRYWELKSRPSSKDKGRRLEDARRLILDAETSCYLFWGDSWIPKLYEKLKAADEKLDTIAARWL